MGFSRAAVLCTIVLALLVGCVKRTDEVAYNPSTFGAPDAAPALVSPTEQQLGPGDVVSVRVFGVDSLSGDYAVDPTGQVNMPLIGKVPAVNRTAVELGQDLTARYGERYLASPQLSVTVKSLVAKTVTVDGAVGSPGIYPIAGRTSLIQTIAMARGTSQDANLKQVIVFRQINGERQAAAFDLTTIRTGTDPDPAIYPNDTVVVIGSRNQRDFLNVIQTLPVIGLFTRF